MTTLSQSWRAKAAELQENVDRLPYGSHSIIQLVREIEVLKRCADELDEHTNKKLALLNPK